MSYDRLIAKEERVKADIAELEAMAAALLADAEASDTTEDQIFGVDGKDTDLPTGLDRREKRLAKMQAARAQIQAEARQNTHAQEKDRAARNAPTPMTSRPSPTRATRPAAKARPKPKAQANFTDPDSRIMKNGAGAYIQAYNAQVVDTEQQVITAADVTTNASDALNYTTMLDQCPANTGIHPRQALVDAGYCSERNLEAAKDRQLTCGTDTFMATGRLAHDEQVPPAPGGRIPANATLKERMARKLRTKPGKAAYRRRKAIVEPVFGQITTCQNGRQLLLRGEDGARGERRLLAACHNPQDLPTHQNRRPHRGDRLTAPATGPPSDRLPGRQDPAPTPADTHRATTTDPADRDRPNACPLLTHAPSRALLGTPSALCRVGCDLLSG
ncbi:DDE family transposase [Streptomyces sp. 846.5]|nr:DDE family transposase [Streptomyces sp. 846.5]